MNLVASLLFAVASDDVDPVALEELRSIVSPLAEASSYTVKVRVERLLPWSEDETRPLEIETLYERGEPLHLRTDGLVAYRSRARIASRSPEGREDWEVEELAEAGSSDAASRELRAMAALPDPAALFARLDDGLVSLHRRLSVDPSAVFVYEARLDSGPAPYLSLFVSQGGHLEQIVLRSSPEESTRDVEDLVWSFRFSRRNATSVDVPKDVQALLEEDRRP